MENNKLLAEYCGYIYTKFKGSDPDHVVRNKDGTWINWHPDIDWNQLMIVVEKIEGKCEWIDVVITRDHCSIESGDTILVSRNWEIKTKIEAVYKACVEYINECL